MEMTSAVIRFALATYFMKTGGNHQSHQSFYRSSWPLSSYEKSLVVEEEAHLSVDMDVSEVLTTHISNLRWLLSEQRIEDWSKGVDELREFITENAHMISLFMEVLVQEQDTEICTQVIEHMCFTKNGEPSMVVDQLIESLDRYCDDQHIAVVRWVDKAVDVIMHRLMQFHEQQFETISANERVEC
ncbi:uncharacterized protein PHALS_02056 [Plasmopara halstedii]|uniref:Armadillo-type fold n=1 Tax=Plasmopara halstedii TaxID=4781 RepID=A0A0P1AU43_PLAHL|nr:uncharacterized protein PHALS_02056 [Plasmopara halstedii]CEG45784.1 hypothetical protein PHALS_02056 [Plasmopara halstedii]|eukprot:XP_024582153.1 hypothetical protein PHALS_02056 [Plasmopara halstedii]